MRSRPGRRLALLLGLAGVAACDYGPNRDYVPIEAAAPQSMDSSVLVAFAPSRAPRPTPLPPEDGEWRMPAKDYANTRFSGLGQIDAGNVARLKLAWTFATGRNVGHEGAPLVVGGTMYLVTPFPNHLVALDLTQPGAPSKWTYKPPYIREAKGVACCDLVNRGPTYADGRVFFNTLDNQVIAVDAASGSELWRVRVGDINEGESMTMAPLVVRDRVIVGNSGGEFGVRGWLKGLDAATGRTVWTAYGTGPDEEVLIGPDFRPFYAKDRGEDLGVKTWPPGAWRQGGSTAWGWISYDPQLDLIFYGTGNPGVWNPDLRPGDNKWGATLFARDPDTGFARWAYQIEPHDLQDYDAVNESILIDVPVNGRMRRALVRHERNGFMYLMDRVTGEVLAVDSVVYSTTTRGVDLKTGLPIKDLDKAPRTGEVVREICPAVPGSKNWSPSAYSPQSGLVFVPFNNLCMDMQGVEANYIAGTPYIGTVHTFYSGPGGYRGGLFAWDPVERRKVWEIREPFPLWSGVLATAGGVVFYGTMDRWFKAVDARTGETLWKFRTASGIVGQPITYRGPDGKQYVAIFDGVGGWAGVIVSGRLSAEDPTAGDGFVGATQDLPRFTERGGTLYVFELP